METFLAHHGLGFGLLLAVPLREIDARKIIIRKRENKNILLKLILLLVLCPLLKNLCLVIPDEMGVVGEMGERPETPSFHLRNNRF